MSPRSAATAAAPASWWARLGRWLRRGPQFPSGHAGPPGRAMPPADAQESMFHPLDAAPPSVLPSQLPSTFEAPARARAPAQPGGAPAPAPAARPLPRPDDYAIDQVVAHHERSTVYRAHHKQTGAVVAFKMVRLSDPSPERRALWRERFLREATAAARLRHPDIVRVQAGGVHGGRMPSLAGAEADLAGSGGTMTGWLAMSWAPGVDLSRWADARRLLPEPLVLSLCGRLALALAHAHRAGVIHRDLKPSNVIFDAASGSVQLTDFGSARVADATSTRTGVLVGTPAYLAPELLTGAAPSPASDFYALGVLMYELLTGSRPYDAPGMGDLLGQIANSPVPSLRSRRPDLPPLVDDILQRLLAKQPARRTVDGQQLALALRLAETSFAPRRRDGLQVSRPVHPPAQDPRLSKAQS